ncbi:MULTISPECIES: LytTR family transcriptional regulator DNA-binding domain-containing protein [Bacteroidaceae]|mgnify:FL=1|uniref:LytTR family transcriptional regulator DNA-binding domain-containing protein n=1 Tax=Bacteroidaceae TaxID=815 RepID=UPI00195E5827|nr:LytTR family transcriptional regulator DNA-binding domain-containing protein [Phocaeicola coprocola]MBM6713610.1 LytTR family transcriptional regulator DNA-binding domain-containing protein [Phocaeicola coprocola]
MKKARKIKNKHSIKRQKSVILSKIKAQRSKSNKEANRKRFAMIEDKEGYACVEANEILYAEGDDKTAVVYVSEQRTFPLSVPIKKAIKQLMSLNKMVTISENCIVNANHISELGENYVVVNGKKLKLDKDRLKDIQNEVCIINIYINC